MKRFLAILGSIAESLGALASAVITSAGILFGKSDTGRPALGVALIDATIIERHAAVMTALWNMGDAANRQAAREISERIRVAWRLADKRPEAPPMPSPVVTLRDIDKPIITP